MCRTGGAPYTSTNLSVSSSYYGITSSFHLFNSGKWFNCHSQAYNSAESGKFSISNVTSLGQNCLELTPNRDIHANFIKFDIFYIL